MKKKRIIIPQNGPIYGKGGVMGPITTPYMEDINTIAIILIRGSRVVEVLDSGEHVELDLNNYDRDNTRKKEETKQIAPQENPPKDEEKPTQTETGNQQQQQQQKNQQQGGNKQFQQQQQKQNNQKNQITADEITEK